MHVLTMRLPEGKITVREAMELSGYCRVMIYNLVRDRKIEGSKTRFGEVIIFIIDRASLLAYCRQRRRLVNEQA